MAENRDETTSLRPLYAARVAEDLERNAQEQERLSSEVAALQEKLETLRHDQALLITMQQALDSAEKAGEAAPAGRQGKAEPRKEDDAEEEADTRRPISAHTQGRHRSDAARPRGRPPEPGG